VALASESHFASTRVPKCNVGMRRETSGKSSRGERRGTIVCPTMKACSHFPLAMLAVALVAAPIFARGEPPAGRTRSMKSVIVIVPGKTAYKLPSAMSPTVTLPLVALPLLVHPPVVLPLVMPLEFNQIVPVLPGEIVPPLPLEITRPLPQQVVRALPGQLVRPLPGQIVQPLPGQIVQPLPGQIVHSS
jgi:hypothetical protein